MEVREGAVLRDRIVGVKKADSFSNGTEIAFNTSGEGAGAKENSWFLKAVFKLG
jgi:hypothetical protein